MSLQRKIRCVKIDMRGYDKMSQKKMSATKIIKVALRKILSI